MWLSSACVRSCKDVVVLVIAITLMWIGASLNKPHIDVKYMSHVGLQTKGAKIAISSVEAMSYSTCEVQRKFHKTLERCW